MLRQKSFIAIMSVGLALMASSANGEILVYEPFVGVPGEAFAGVETESVNLGQWSEPVPRVATDNAQFVEFPAYTDPDGVVLPSKGVGAVLRGDLFDESVALDSPATFASGKSAWIGLQAGLRDKGGSGFDRQHSRIRFHFDASDLEVRWDTEGVGGARDNQLVQLVLQGATGGATTSGEDIPYPAVGEPVNEFILIRIDFSAGDETIRLWRNPSLSSRPADGDALLTGTQELGSTLSGITARTQAFHTELILDEIRIGETFNDAVGQEGSNAIARSPLPKNESADALHKGTTLSWRAGESAQTHNVYFGTAFDDVNNASVSAPLGVLVSKGQSDNAYGPGRLDFDQTYYWRVDEVNGAPDFTVFKGDVWSITAEPFSLPISDVTVTASSTFGNAVPDHTVDGSGLTGDLHSSAVADMWISGSIPASIEYEFDRSYKLDEMWVWNSNQIIESFVGFGAKDVVIEYSLDGTDWTQLEGVTSLAQAPGADGYAANSIVDFGGAAASHVRITINSVHGIAPQTGLSEVRFFSIPVRAREAQPENGATGLDPAVVLGWRTGRGAVSHDIALSSDPADATVIDTATDNTFDTAALDPQLGETYFWSITEVNDAETPSAWTSDTWRFSIVDSLVVDDMESYEDAEFLEIWATWIDGFDNPAGNGAVVGANPDGGDYSPETGIVHGGNQSLPIHYDNTGAPFSEAERSFSPAQDWTRAGIQTLVLFFAGDPANTGGRVYVTINGTKVSHAGDADALTKPRWTQWNIDLSTVNTNLNNVTSLAVGVEGGGAGLLLVDDILLYRQAPSADHEEVWIEGEATDTQGERWRITDDPTASGGRYLGSEDGDGDDNTDPPGAEWMATYKFTVSGGTYTISARIITLPGNSFWFRIPGATSPQITRPDGWINTNPMDNGDTWHWDEDVVEFTLSAGEHTLEIAKREDGTLLDALVITDKLE